MGVGGQRHASAALPPRKKPGNHCTGGWVWTDAKNLSPHRNSIPGPFIPVTSRYTDCAIPAHKTHSTQGKALMVNIAPNLRHISVRKEQFWRNYTKHGPGGARFSEPVQTGSETHPASYTMGTGSFPGVKRPGRDVDHPPHLAPRLKKE